MQDKHFNALEDFAKREAERLRGMLDQGPIRPMRNRSIGDLAQDCGVAGPTRPILAHDIQHLSAAINSLDDAVTAIGQAVAPVSSGDSRAIEDPSMPPPSSEVSAAVIDALRRVLIITQRAQVIREQIRL